MHQNAAGLELVRASDGEWGAVHEKDKYIVIVGDMIERLSNGHIKATAHRVIRTAWSVIVISCSYSDQL